MAEEAHNTRDGRSHSAVNTISAPSVAPPKSNRGRKSGGSKSEQPQEGFESPLGMDKGVEKLKRVLRKYHVEERVLERLQLGVAAFMLITEETMREMLGSDIEAYHTGILIGLRKAMQKEMNQHSVEADLFGGAGSKSSSSSSTSTEPQSDLAEEQRLHGVGGAKEGEVLPAPVDPYVYGKDNQGKIDVYALYGLVGGGLATTETRMLTSVKVGDIKKNYISLRIARFNMELHTTNKDRPIQRADEWACIIAIMGSDRWKTLGQSNWEVDVDTYMREVMRGLLLAPNLRQGFQNQCHFLNNIR